MARVLENRWVKSMCSVGLRGRIVGLVVLVILPFSGFQLITAYQQYNLQLRRDLIAHEQLAHAVGATFTNYVEDLWATEKAIGTAMAIGDMSTKGAETLLGALLPNYPTLDYLFWTSPDGTILASAPSSWAGVSVSFRDYFQRIVEGEDEVISDMIVGRYDGEAAFVVAQAIRQEGKLIGVVLARTPIKKLNQVIPVSDGAVVALVDRQATTMYHTATDGPVGPNRPADPLALRALRGEANSGNYTNPNSRDWSGVGVPLSRLGWAVSVSAETLNVRAAAGYAAIRSTGVALLIIVLAILGAVSGTKWVLQPVKRLQAAAISLSEGNMSARVVPGGVPEVAAAARAFNHMADRVAELQTQRTRFLQTAAHELRNPMAGIKAMLSMINWMMEKGQPDDLARFLGVVEREVDRLSGLLNEILEAFRVQEGHLGLKQEPVNLATVIEAAVQAHRVMETEHFVTLQGVSHNAAWVLGDAERLEGVIRVVLGNASKYSPAGSEIVITLAAFETTAQITVKDHGLGIPAHQLNKVFEQFFRADNLSGRDPGGLGLGLYVARVVVTGHGGRIWAESEEGVGSTFVIELPLHHTRMGDLLGQDLDH